MRQVFSNAVILEGEDLEITRGYLVVKDREIREISEGSPAGRAIDLKGGIIMPPFINSHTHVGDSVGKELYLGRSQPDVVGPGGIKFRAIEASTPQRIVSSIRATLKDMLRTGTIAHYDFREGGLAGIDLLRKASQPPLRSFVLGRGSNFEEFCEVLMKADGIGVSSIDVLDFKELREISQRARKARKLFTLHAAETLEAQKRSLRTTGKGEIKRALELKPSFIIHATHSSREDLKLLMKRRIPVVFCPRSNHLLSVGSPPIDVAMELGIEFWLGTDNVMISQPNMFEELRFAWACLRLKNKRAGRGEARRLLIAATVAPLRHFNSRGGVLSPGREATFLILSKKNNLTDVVNIHAGILNRARADNLRAFFIAGENIF
jgi:cytosine/adenosine deaminase-related metal-dependent hydrolase